jgi:hypothetical protein
MKLIAKLILILSSKTIGRLNTEDMFKKVVKFFVLQPKRNNLFPEFLCDNDMDTDGCGTDCEYNV